MIPSPERGVLNSNQLVQVKHFLSYCVGLHLDAPITLSVTNFLGLLVCTLCSLYSLYSILLRWEKAVIDGKNSMAHPKPVMPA